MAIIKKKSKHPIGKIGDSVSYVLNGQLIVRSIGLPTSNPTLNQLAARNAVKLTSQFLNGVMEFIAVGFEIEAKLHKTSPQNEAFSYNRIHAITGEYPNQYLDYAKVRLSTGKMPVVDDLAVKMEEDGLRCTWSKEDKLRDIHWSDQVMMIGYFPLLGKSAMTTAGAIRNSGTDLLLFSNMPKGYEVETYVAFISSDRKQISNSIYTGRFYW